MKDSSCNDDNNDAALASNEHSHITTEETAAEDGWMELMGKDLVMKIVDDPSLDGEIDESLKAVQPGDAVVIEFQGAVRSKGDQQLVIFQPATTYTIVVGEKDVVPALEMGVRFLRVGATAVVRSHSKYVYGPGQRKQKRTRSVDVDKKKKEEEFYHLPPHANGIEYQVTVQKKLPNPDPVELARAKKAIANDVYACEWVEGDPYWNSAKARAYQLYRRGAELLQNIVLEDGDDQDARTVFLDCLNNMIVLHLRAKEYKLAKEAAVRVLQTDPSNVKALVRAAKAALHDPASSYEEVEAALAAAEEEGGKVDALRTEYQQKKRDYQKRTKAMFQGKIVAKKQKDSVSSTSKATEDADSSTAETSLQSEPLGGENTASSSTGFSLAQSLRSWPFWKSKILPYGVQLIMPLVMYYMFTRMKHESQLRKQQDEGLVETHQQEF